MPKSALKKRDREVLGMFTDRGVVYLFFRETANPDLVAVEVSSDGEQFGKLGGEVIMRDGEGKRVAVRHWKWMQVARADEFYILMAGQAKGKVAEVLVAEGHDLNWMVKKYEVVGLTGRVALVNGYRYKDNWVALEGGDELALRFSSDLKKWKEKLVLVPGEADFFGKMQIAAGNVFVESVGLVVMYFVHRNVGKVEHYEMRGLVVDPEEPTRVRRQAATIWEAPVEWAKNHPVPLGVVKLGRDYVSYWQGDSGVWAVKHRWLVAELNGAEQLPKIDLDRAAHNPIIVPVSGNLWESRATFNPAAITDEEGKVHMLYRAIGEDDISVLGYAASEDGWHIDQRHPEPVFRVEKLEENEHGRLGKSPVSYLSGGGGFGGCEDPRLVRIGDRVYMTYVAFNGWDSVRMMLTSIAWEDFLGKNWNWDQPVALSMPGQIHKNWVMFPEKINGKFAILHSVSPNIMIDYFDKVEEFAGDKYIRSKYVKQISRGRWDSWVRGAGPPPIRTKYGWLLLYHAMDIRDPNRYKLGAMVLDSERPTKVLYRSNGPILEPDLSYENEGFKAGVIYACGAVVKDEQLLVYYGGADTVVCAAAANLDRFMHKLRKHRHVELTPRLVVPA